MRCPACDHDNLPGDDLCQDCGLDLAGLDVSGWGITPEDPVLARVLGTLPLKEPLTLGPDAMASEAVELMNERGEGCVFVTARAEGPPDGVFTERDVAVRVVVPGRDPSHTPLHEVMTRNPVTLQKDDALAWALHRMGVDGYRHLPVLDGERLIGFLSIRTVLGVLVGREAG
jgi:CBS domain-containing protein